MQIVEANIFWLLMIFVSGTSVTPNNNIDDKSRKSHAMLLWKAFPRFLGVKCFIFVCPLFWLISDINNIVGGIDQATLAPSPMAAWSGHSDVSHLSQISDTACDVWCVHSGLNCSWRGVSPSVTGVNEI